MITKYLPKFKVFEVNSLTGLRAGHMISQVPAQITYVNASGAAATGVPALAHKKLEDEVFVENGIIMGLGAAGVLENYDPAKHAQPFVHFTEELNTFLSDLEYFAVESEAVKGETNTVYTAYPRGIGLYVGDTFTTNNYSGTVTGAKAAKVVNGVLTLQTAADSDSRFLATPSTLPNGAEAVEFTYVGQVVASAGN